MEDRIATAFSAKAINNKQIIMYNMSENAGAIPTYTYPPYGLKGSKTKKPKITVRYELTEPEAQSHGQGGGW